MAGLSVVDQLRDIEEFAELEGARPTSANATGTRARVGGEVSRAMRTDGAAPQLLFAVIEAAQSNIAPIIQPSAEVIEELDAAIARIRKHIAQTNAQVRKLLMRLARAKKLAVARANTTPRVNNAGSDYCAIAQELNAQIRNLMEIIPLSTSAIHRIRLPKLQPICAQPHAAQSPQLHASRLQLIVNSAIRAHQEDNKHAQLLEELKKMDAILDIIDAQCATNVSRVLRG